MITGGSKHYCVVMPLLSVINVLEKWFIALSWFLGGLHAALVRDQRINLKDMVFFPTEPIGLSKTIEWLIDSADTCLKGSSPLFHVKFVACLS